MRHFALQHAIRYNALSIFLAATLFNGAVYASSDEGELKLQVIDPFIEVHTGPGKGYPIFYTVEERESVHILRRSPDWYEIQLDNGSKGWVPAHQIARTLLPTGQPVDLPEIRQGDYLKEGFHLGFSTGHFTSGEIKGSDFYSVEAGYRPLSWLESSFEYARFHNNDLRGNVSTFRATVEPLSHWRFSPQLRVGVGTLKISTQPELIPVDFEDSSFVSIGVGVSTNIGRNFIIQAGYDSLSLSSDSDIEIDENNVRWTISTKAHF